MKQILMTLMIGTLVAACAKQETAQSSATPASAPTPAAAVTAANTAPAATMANESAAPAQPAASAKLAGTIVETMDSGGYTYMKLKTAQGEQWVATPQAQVKKGQLVTVTSQMTAEKFESSTLKRTFDRIVFGTLEAPGAPGAQTAAANAAPAMPPNMTSNMASAMGSPADHMKARVDVGDVNVPKAEGGKTVAEVWSGRAALADKEVVVRGKVVKFLGGIMGTNFLHVRDGSGSEANGDHDLTVTTSEMASVGDVVTVRGVVHVDKDFGAGYRYPVILEKASIQK